MHCGNPSVLHSCDARVKIVLLVAYCITLFLVNSWAGLALCALAFAFSFVLSGLSARHMFALTVPVFALGFLVVVCNSFSMDVLRTTTVGPQLEILPGLRLPVGLDPVPLAGTFGFVPEGFVRGCFHAVRIFLLVLAVLVVSFSTSSSDAMAALGAFMSPLRRFGVPVDDAVMVFVLAIRFMPLAMGELGRIRDAQWSRGAPFGEGSYAQRLRLWQSVFAPLIAGLFRRADALAQGMDARCYGAADVRRTSLVDRRFTSRSALSLCTGLAACALISWLF